MSKEYELLSVAHHLIVYGRELLHLDLCDIVTLLRPHVHEKISTHYSLNLNPQ